MCEECSASVETEHANASLLGRVGQGDRHAFTALYQFYAPRLVTWFRLRGASEDHAREQAQDVMLQVWRDAASFPVESGAASAWVAILARDRAEQNRPDPAWQDQVVPVAGLVVPPDAAARVRAAYQGLAPEVRQCLSLVLIQGMTHSRAAQRLGVPLGTLKSWLSRGVARLRKAARAGPPEGEP